MTNEQLKLWERVQDQIIALERLDLGWDGSDAPPIAPRMVRATISWSEHLKSQELDPPNDVYPLSDGNVVLEWHLPDDVIRRVEIMGDGVAQEMLTFPTAGAKFKTMTWHPSNYIMGYLAKAGQFVSIAECCDEYDDEFSCSLAA